MSARLDDFVFCQQVHRPNVSVVTEEMRGSGAYSHATAVPSTDAMVTTVPGLVLAVMLADCVPLVLMDPGAVSPVLGCVHAGWGGTVRGVTRRAVEIMIEQGAEPSRIIAGIGPAISPSMYEVGSDVHQLAELEFGVDIDDVMRPHDSSGKWLFDLWQANRLHLLASGVRGENIHLAALPTGPGTDFFSHRLDGPCGRFVTAARIRER